MQTLLKLQRVTIQGAQPSPRLSEEICLSEVSAGVSPRVLRGSLRGSALSGLPNANAKSPRFTYAISKIATLPPVVALNRSSKSQIAARYAAFWHAVSQIVLASSFSDPKSQRFKSQCLQDANATKSQTLAFYGSRRFGATKVLWGSAGSSEVFRG